MRAGAVAPRIAADTSGAALTALVADGSGSTSSSPMPRSSPSSSALGRGRPRGRPREAIALARTIPTERVRASLVTLGAVGAALVTAEAAWFARAPRVVPRSTVGAGDCSLAGYFVADVEAGRRPVPSPAPSRPAPLPSRSRAVRCPPET